MTLIRPIITEYNGNRFRSRLEARWAALFDLAGLPYIYEPADMDGYLPDFLIPGPHPLYVEVGPVFTAEEYRAKAQKPRRALSGEQQEFIVLGTDPLARGLRETWAYPTIGLQFQWFGPPEDAGFDEGSPATLTHDNVGLCHDTVIVNMVQSYTRYPCGHHDGSFGWELDAPTIERMWAEAGKKTQWR